ncbi:hypothetical protein E2C01_053766 [Portunus trituberculatus]|uniref:Uncharacterized protein n=1 Tax=Portunus trituberculatus TaxID=210409 RepID=A0A5B7GRP8_PORTR|nr:hypothetical protein [Portunus trituberculatus]
MLGSAWAGVSQTGWHDLRYGDAAGGRWVPWVGEGSR